MVTRPLPGYFGMEIGEGCQLHSFSLVSDQRLCTAKAFGNVTTEILIEPRAGALSSSRRSLGKTFKGKYTCPYPIALTSYP